MNFIDYVELVTNPYNNKKSHNRKGLMINGPWVDELYEFIEKNKVKSIFLNSARGWDGSDYSFLSKLDTIEELDLIAYPDVKNLSSIEQMSSLKELSITCNCKEIINFSKLQNLEKCFLNWWAGAESIFNCISIKELYLDEFKTKKNVALGELEKLTSLTIGNSNIATIEWLKYSNSLREIKLLNCKKINDFSPMSLCKNLRSVTIDGSKLLYELGFFKELKLLEFINISNNSKICSLKPLESLTNLKALCFSGNTVIEDGNLGVLEKLPQLSMLMFQGKRHYSHKLLKEWDWSNYDVPDKLLKEK